jgi:hypothetical protein
MRNGGDPVTLFSPVRQWLSGLRPVSHRGISAWVNDSWDLLNGFPDPGTWTAAETELIVTLFRPARTELTEFVEEQNFELEDKSVFDESTPVWNGFVDGSRPMVTEGLVRAADLFSVSFAVDGMCCSSSWQWRAIALTSDLALFCEVSDNYGLQLFPAVFGVTSRTRPYASAALLLKSRADKDSERFLDRDNFFDELSASKIRDAEVYRLLLARSGHGGTRILSASRRELIAFRTRNMACGFSDVQRLLRQTIARASAS